MNLQRERERKQERVPSKGVYSVMHPEELGHEVHVRTAGFFYVRLTAFVYRNILNALFICYYFRNLAQWRKPFILSKET